MDTGIHLPWSRMIVKTYIDKGSAARELRASSAPNRMRLQTTIEGAPKAHAGSRCYERRASFMRSRILVALTPSATTTVLFMLFVCLAT